MIDSYYTDPTLADRLINYLPKDICVCNVADFCVGGGELLNATLRRFPKAICTGIDINNDAVDELSLLHPEWRVLHNDFMDGKAVDASIGDTLFDLIVLNPPFSCKGSQVISVSVSNKEYKVSTSMAFVLKSIKYLKPQGVILAILPLSVVYSQKDRNAWNYLKENHNACLLEERERYSFKGCSPGIVLVAINYPHKDVQKESSLKIKIPFSVQLKRGALSMSNVQSSDSGQWDLLHTTNLSDNRICNVSTKVNTTSIVKGPAVLIPRVCNPNVGKVVLVTCDKTYAISDCIIALQVFSDKDAEALYKILLADWNNVKMLYKGTGAKYITLERLKSYLGIK